ncbi:unnamed protein product [Gemmataceae bacterium]|nr:unnamed protein product [Gemmataceae bacterium]VTU02773.1 unnamed protein product [Gemmataceae bacterium]
MSQTAIGRAALILSANASGLRSGLDQAGQHAKTWADATASGMNSRLKDVGKDTGRGGFLAMAGRFAGPAAAAVAGVVGVREAISELDEVARTGAAAKAFGLTAEQFSGMAGVAKSVGGNQREFIESLVTLGKLSAEGAAGKGEVATEFFKKLNLNAKEFNALSLEDKFYGVFEAIQKLGAGEGVRPLMTAFGEDGGKQLLSLLSKTPAELRTLGSSLAVSTGEVEKAAAANAELTRAGSTLSAGWRTIAVAVAPAIGRVANLVGNLRPAFEWIGQWLEVQTDLWSAAFTEIGGWIRSAAAEIGGWIHELTGLGDTTWTIKDVVVLAWRAVGTAGALAWDTIKAGAGLVITVLGYFVSGVSYVTDAFADLVDLAKKLPDAIRPSWVNEFADGVRFTSKIVEGTGRELRQWGADAAKGWGDSALKFNGWLDGVANKTAAQAKAAAQESIAATTQAAAALTKIDNAALIRGSSAEVNYRVKHDFGSTSPQAKMLDEQKKANKELIGINVGVKKVADRLADRGELATV